MKPRTKNYAAPGNPGNVISTSARIPDWIIKAEHNARQRERRYAKKHGCTMRDAHVALAQIDEDRAQGDA